MDTASALYVKGDLTPREQQRHSAVIRKIKEIIPEIPDDYILEALKKVKSYVFDDLWNAGEAWSVSSGTFYFRVHEYTWRFIMREMKEPPAFPFVPPAKKFDAPFSLACLELYYRRQVVNNEKARQDKLAEGYKCELPRRTPEHTFNQEQLKALWKKVFPGRRYERHCGPFQWILPSEVAFHEYVGCDLDDLLHTMNSIASTIGGRDLVLVCARGDLRDLDPDIPRDDARLVRFELGPAAGVDVEDLGFQLRIQGGYLDLFQIHSEIMAGHKINMLARLRENYVSRLNSRSTRDLSQRRQALAQHDENMAKSLAAKPDDTERLGVLLTAQRRALMGDARKVATRVLEGCCDDWQVRRKRLEDFATGKLDERFACLSWKDLAMLVCPLSKQLGMERIKKELDRLQSDQLCQFAEGFVLNDGIAHGMAMLLDQHTRLEIIEESFALVQTLPQVKGFRTWLANIRDKIDSQDEV
ncbi:hypothetical protein F5X99DRAFT_428949 [Biscogniauxia marginata]|nr:hypothetical protein F5X99DRAFT_428949 [Biscogniauxia marginata]